MHLEIGVEDGGVFAEYKGHDAVLSAKQRRFTNQRLSRYKISGLQMDVER